MVIIFQDYERLKFLGKGSFAKIYKVRHKDLGYIRAIKVLTEDVSDDENDKVYRTFVKECSLLLRIGNGGHPNIIRIYQPRKIDGQALVEMDYVDGVTLEEYISKNRFVPMDEIYRYIREIGSALAYCHVDCYKYMMRPEEKGRDEEELVKAYGVAHNDIHSNNIMRKNLDGSFILLDFGLAIQDDKAVKSSSRRDGAAEYIPPEKWSGTEISNEKAIDVYGFGILLYQMLTGRVPFILDQEAYSKDSLKTLNELRYRHENERPADILPLRAAAFEATHEGKTYVRDYPEWLDELVFKCLEKNPDDRFHDAKELLGFFKQHELSDELKRDSILNEFKEANEALMEKSTSLEKENTTLKSEVLSLKGEVLSLKEQVNGLKENKQPQDEPTPVPAPDPEIIRKLKNENKALKTENSSLKDDLKQAKNELFFAGVSSSPPQKPNKTPIRVLAVVSAVLLITTALGAVGTWTNAFDNVTWNRINYLESENTRLTEQLAEAESNAVEVKEPSSSDTDKTIRQLNARIESLTSDISNKDKEISEKDSQISTLESDISEKDKQITTLNASDQSATVTKLQKEKQTLQNENKKLKEENASLNTKVENLTELLLKN